MQQNTTVSAMQEARLMRGWTLRQLANRCAHEGVPVDNSQLSKIERGIYAPRPALRAVLAELLDLDIGYFDRQKAAS